MFKQELQDMPFVTVEQVLAMRMSMMARINELEGKLLFLVNNDSINDSTIDKEVLIMLAPDS